MHFPHIFLTKLLLSFCAVGPAVSELLFCLQITCCMLMQPCPLDLCIYIIIVSGHSQTACQLSHYTYFQNGGPTGKGISDTSNTSVANTVVH